MAFRPDGNREISARVLRSFESATQRDLANLEVQLFVHSSPTNLLCCYAIKLLQVASLLKLVRSTLFGYPTPLLCSIWMLEIV